MRNTLKRLLACGLLLSLSCQTDSVRMPAQSSRIRTVSIGNRFDRFPVSGPSKVTAYSCGQSPRWAAPEKCVHPFSPNSLTILTLLDMMDIGSHRNSLAPGMRQITGLSLKENLALHSNALQCKMHALLLTFFSCSSTFYLSTCRRLFQIRDVSLLAQGSGSSWGEMVRVCLTLAPEH